MNQVWVLIDGNNLCWRAYHAHKDLSYQDVKTGMIYGILNDILTLRRLCQTNRFVWCFDHGRGIREYRYPFYKESRRIRKITPENEKEEERKSEVRQQIERVRTEYLPGLGYHNIFWRDGYEADDIIASVVTQLPDGDEAVIVSSDKDLYQLVSEDVTVYEPRTKFWHNLKWFWKKYGIDPMEWKYVKAIAGCSTDDVPGVEGVGDLKASAFLRNELPDTPFGEETRRKIKEFRKTTQYKQNLDIVKIPYKGCPVFQLAVDSVDVDAWKKLCKRLGIRKLP